MTTDDKESKRRFERNFKARFADIEQTARGHVRKLQGLTDQNFIKGVQDEENGIQALQDVENNLQDLQDSAKSKAVSISDDLLVDKITKMLVAIKDLLTGMGKRNSKYSGSESDDAYRVRVRGVLANSEFGDKNLAVVPAQTREIKSISRESEENKAPAGKTSASSSFAIETPSPSSFASIPKKLTAATHPASTLVPKKDNLEQAEIDAALKAVALFEQAELEAEIKKIDRAHEEKHAKQPTSENKAEQVVVTKTYYKEDEILAKQLAEEENKAQKQLAEDERLAQELSLQFEREHQQAAQNPSRTVEPVNSAIAQELQQETQITVNAIQIPNTGASVNHAEKWLQEQQKEVQEFLNDLKSTRDRGFNEFIDIQATASEILSDEDKITIFTNQRNALATPLVNSEILADVLDPSDPQSKEVENIHASFNELAEMLDQQIQELERNLGSNMQLR